MQSNTLPAAFAAPASPLFVRVVDVDQRPHTINLLQVADLRCWPDKYFHGAIELATGNVVDLNRDNYALVSSAVHGLTFNAAGKPGPLPLREPFRDLHPEQSQDYLDAQGRLSQKWACKTGNNRQITGFLGSFCASCTFLSFNLQCRT